jgi:hypothetical protein
MMQRPGDILAVAENAEGMLTEILRRPPPPN